MSNCFLKSGTKFRVTSKESMDLHDELPAANYTIQVNPLTGEHYLETIDNFSIPSTLYGSTIKDATRIISTFTDRPASTGVLLTGEKGSGKTLLAKVISCKARQENNLPTITINTPLCGDAFNLFIQSIEQPCIIIFDEFEKVYNEDDQMAILTLLDGVFNSKKLFVITCNDKWRIDSHMRNRPGRVFYMLDFTGLSVDFVIEYCNDNLKNKTYIEQVCKVSTLFDQFNFDMLQALVEEMNRYDESPTESLRMLNTKPEFSGNQEFEIGLRINNVDIDQDRLNTTKWEGSPLKFDYLSLYYKIFDVNKEKTKKNKFSEKDSIIDCPAPIEVASLGSARKTKSRAIKKDSEDNFNWSDDISFKAGDLVSMDAKTGKFIFVNSDKDQLTLIRIQKPAFNYWGAL